MENECNEGHYSEAGDRCHVVICLIDQVLNEHPAIVDIGRQCDIEQVQEVLANLYQDLFRKDDEVNGDNQCS